MSNSDRAALYRKRALDAESKVFVARTEEMRRSWLILARDWTRMAEGLEGAPSIVPSQKTKDASLEQMISGTIATRVLPG